MKKILMWGVFIVSSIIPLVKKFWYYTPNLNPIKNIGVSGFEPPLSRPPDAHFNLTKLHPEIKTKLKIKFIANSLRLLMKKLFWMVNF